MKTNIYILALSLILLMGCESKFEPSIKEAEAYLKEYPDSVNKISMPERALSILEGIDSTNLSKDNRTKIAILKAYAKYKLYKPYDIDLIDSCREQIISISNEDPSLYYKYLYLKAFHFFEDAKYPEAMNYAMKGFQLSNKYNDHLWTAKNSQMIGDILCRNCNWPGALQQDSVTIEEYLKAGRLRDANFAKVDYLMNLSSSGDIQNAQEQFLANNEAWIGTNDSALISYNLTRYVLCLIDNGMISDAKSLLAESDNFNPHIAFQSQYYNALFEISLLDNNIPKAQAYLDSIEKDDDEGIGEVRYLDAKSKYLKKKGDYKRALEVTDSIILISNEKIKALLTQSVVAAQRDFYDDVAKEEALKAENNRNTLIIVSVGALILILLALFYYRYHIKLKNIELQNKINQIYNLSQNLDRLTYENSGLNESVHSQEEALNKLTSELELNLQNIERMKEEIKQKEEADKYYRELISNEKGDATGPYDMTTIRKELEKLQIKEKENNERIRDLYSRRLDYFNKFSNIYLTKKDSPKVKKTLVSDFEEMLEDMKKTITSGEVEQQVNLFFDDVIAELRQKCNTLSEKDLLMTTLIYAGFMPRYIAEVCGYSPNYFYVKKNRIIKKILNAMPDSEASPYIDFLKDA
ncbi:MAG: hypothetical protein K2G67_02345 [Muribaculaceae bacterium]|nr:hypothetical protein [Muribaculaceae bacterium]